MSDEITLQAFRCERDRADAAEAERDRYRAVVRAAREYIEGEFPGGAEQASEFEVDHKALALIQALVALEKNDA